MDDPTGDAIVLQLDGNTAFSDMIRRMSIENGVMYTFGPVTRDNNGSRLRCNFALLTQCSPDIILNVICELSHQFVI